jgi:hypothetical protein
MRRDLILVSVAVCAVLLVQFVGYLVWLWVRALGREATLVILTVCLVLLAEAIGFLI